MNTFTHAPNSETHKDLVEPAGLGTLGKWESIVDICNTVERSGKHNYQGCKIPVESGINCDAFECMLTHYENRRIVDFLRYGWPIGTTREIDKGGDTEVRNHKGATEYSEQVRSYLIKEIEYGSVMGPFVHSPFSGSVKISPLNTTEKKSGMERRVILDLSFPEGLSVNDCIPKREYLGDSVTLRYAKVDDLGNLIHKKGRSCLMYKRDLKRAYRQFRVDPGDVRKLGYRWEDGIYFDLGVSMGLRTGAHICQSITNAVGYIITNMGYSIVVYLDDFAGAEIATHATQAFEATGHVFRVLGMTESMEKACAPNIVMEFLGVWFNTHSMTMEIEPGRLQEIRKGLRDWSTRTQATRKEVESLVGLLSFVSKCVRPSRIFMGRMFDFLKSLPKKGVQPLTIDFKRDIYWWSRFMPIYNGVSLIPVPHCAETGSVLVTDACLTGCGGFNHYNGEYFHAEFPERVRAQDVHINVLELWAIMVAIKIWGPQLKGSRFRMQCDNTVAVAAMNMARIRCRAAQALMREISYLCAIYEIEAFTVHIDGLKNEIADALSRWHLGGSYQSKFWELTSTRQVKEVYTTEDTFLCTGEWW